MIASDDPLNEGYFRHIVNFDISDTGQSVTARKGYITTSLRYADGTPVNLSNQTIFLKNNSTNMYIALDLETVDAYLVDIKIKDNYLEVERKIANVDATDLIAFLKNYQQFKAVYDSTVIFRPNTTIKFIQQEYDYPENFSETYWVSDIVDGEVIINTVAPGETDLTVTNIIVGPDDYFIETYEYYNYLRDEGYFDYTSDRDYSKYVLQNLLKPNLKHEDITDEYTINKTLLNVSYENYPFMLEIYYREHQRIDGDITHEADTLVFSAVDTEQNTSLDTSTRNIACSKSIIPEVLQVLQNPRPIGHVSTLVPFMYVDDNTNYHTNYIHRNKFYKFIPSFDIADAELELNSSEDCSWAFRFDVVNTSEITPKMYEVTGSSTGTVYRTPWMKYQNVPELIFPSRDNDIMYTGDLDKRHYKDTRYLLYIVPKETNVRTYGANAGASQAAIETDLEVLYNVSDQDEWAAKANEESSVLANANKIYDALNKKNIKEALKDLQEFNFLLYDMWEDDAPYDTNAETKYGNMYLSATYNFNKTYSVHKYYHRIKKVEDSIVSILTADEVAERIDEVFGVTAVVLPCRKDYEAFTVFLDVSYNNQERTPAVLKKDYMNYNQEGFDVSKFYNNKISTSTTALKSISVLNKFFDNGFILNFYLRPYKHSELNDGEGVVLNKEELHTLKYVWDTSSFLSSVIVGYTNDPLLPIEVKNTIDPPLIQHASNFIVYKDTYLVKWTKNILYISEPGTYYDFKTEGKKEFNEKIIKVLPYREILLVFTVQHLYAVYLQEVVEEVEVAKDKVEQVKTYIWSSQIVLYNILTKEEYADVIQVFNQMILFYSEDGQLFMIKPSTMIDSETRFTLQYFNKSVNDILQNYDKYINERLGTYGKSKINKTDVKIKTLLSINFIKIFYYVPGVITYILIYDVINNRYNVYDSIAFHNIKDLCFIDSGDMYITEHNLKTYVTIPHINNYDMCVYSNFKKMPVYSLIDTGNLNLNNHLRKRFRNLYITLKNLNTDTILFNMETVLDDVVSHPFYVAQLEIQDMYGTSYFTPAIVSNTETTAEFVADIPSESLANSSLFLNLDNTTASKLMNYKTSILGVGKVFRLKLQFVSKGRYKIQSYGIVYKERRV